METNKIFMDVAQRAREFAEMCERMANETKQKSDPEAWREECRKKQAAGVKFQRKSCGEWLDTINMFDFSGNKEDYREVPQEDLNLKPTGDRCYEMQIEQPAIGVISSFNKWDRVLTEKEISDLFSGKVRPEDIPQEAPKIKEIGIEPQPPTPHAAERAWRKAQREAGTNEVWQWKYFDGAWVDIIDLEPRWTEKEEYRVKPMKLTAKIVRNIPMTFREYETRLHDWEFFGTREEYIAECEKYGYFVTGKIKEVGQVKPKTVKCYMAMLKDKVGQPFAFAHSSREEIEAHAKLWDITIIGDIEEREIEA